jgi:hypothetical protein
MPFDTSYDDIYKLGIKQCCIDAGAYCERVDEQMYNESILQRIYNQISKADIIIADMTGRNPNVFYEVGYAHALGKTTILVTKETADIPFDLLHFPHIVYKNSITTLKDQLTQKVRWCVENENISETDFKINIELYLGSQKLSKGNTLYREHKDRLPQFEITIHNNSIRSYKPEEYQIGIITPQNYYRLIDSDAKRTVLPDGRLLHTLLHNEDVLYPDSFSGKTFALDRVNLSVGEQEFIIRLNTLAGSRDYPIKVLPEKLT